MTNPEEPTYIAQVRKTRESDSKSAEHSAKLEPYFDREGTLQGLRVATGEDDVFRHGDWLRDKFDESVTAVTKLLRSGGEPTIETLAARMWTAEEKGISYTYMLTIKGRLGARKQGATAANGGLTGTPASTSHPPRYIVRACQGSMKAWGTVEPWFNHKGQLVDFGPIIWAQRGAADCFDGNCHLERAMKGALARLADGEISPMSESCILAIDGAEQIRYDAIRGIQERTGEWARIEATR